MAKTYVILNFSDYIAKGSLTQRANPVVELEEAFGKRVERKGGTYYIHHVADIFGEVRAQRHGVPIDDVKGLLDEGWVRTLSVEAAVFRRRQWSAMIDHCREADKIIFSAHGEFGDSDVLHCQTRDGTFRCGTIDGAISFLESILNVVQRPDPTIALSICYAARSAEHLENHEQPLTHENIRSSIAFKLFRGLSAVRPLLRLTARTGAVAPDILTGQLRSETEDRIIATETLSHEFPDNERDALVDDAQNAYQNLDLALTSSNLTVKQKEELQDRLDNWARNFDPAELDAIIRAIDSLDNASKAAWVRALAFVGAIDSPSWSETFRNDVWIARGVAPRRHELQQLLNRSEAQPIAKYGKFVYQRDPKNRIVVSRWDGNALVRIARLYA